MDSVECGGWGPQAPYCGGTVSWVSDLEVINNTEAHRFEIQSDGDVARLNYSLIPGGIRLIHTEVPPALRGKGYANALAHHALEYARTNGDRVVPICPFVQKYLIRHPEYAPLIDPAQKT